MGKNKRSDQSKNISGNINNNISSKDIDMNISNSNTVIIGNIHDPVIGTNLDNRSESSNSGKILNWSIVRVLGELQILTRASYIALLIIPLIAGVWPSVKSIANNYNEPTNTIVERLEATSKRLSLDARIISEARNSDNDITEISKELKSNIESFKDGLNDIPLRNKEMPIIWVFAFLSALFTIIAHTIYQIFCPETIKLFTIRSLVDTTISDKIRTHEDYFSQIGKNSQRLSDLVKQANSEYTYEANKNHYLSKASAVFYIVSVFFILTVVYLQTKTVLVAAGWG